MNGTPAARRGLAGLLGGEGAELRPEGAEGDGGLAAGGEGGDRGALGGHALDQGQGGDRGLGYVGACGPQVGGYFAVQPLAAIDHGEEGADPGAVAVDAGHEIGELIKGAHGQDGRNRVRDT
jgi:hypothetical protein